jgi:DNA-binding CsgD family transcriptional regulator
MSDDPPENRAPSAPKELVLSADEQARALVIALEGLPSALFVVDTSLRVLLHNRVARQLVERGSIRLVAGHVTATTDVGTMELEELVRTVAARDPLAVALSEPDRLVLARESGAPLSIQALLMRPAPADEKSPPGIVALFVLDPDVRGGLDEATIRHLYDLNDVEARVAALVTNGASLDAVAAALDLAPNVVRHHLQRVLEKTHTEKQSDLIRKLLHGPAGLR